ncbi:hypothetical protein N657DRAFT_195904 [Parathielavia appendiculata]|uniref:Uncharacterized protein n=1 Tax=Parathielavia appendiculata TaxID=2587402 RepID=A0AAN6U670_9PEZI|nr:hypothetical protein N657DRAFT_195904 [Parathielavia appendiculata]
MKVRSRVENEMKGPKYMIMVKWEWVESAYTMARWKVLRKLETYSGSRSSSARSVRPRMMTRNKAEGHQQQKRSSNRRFSVENGIARECRCVAITDWINDYSSETTVPDTWHVRCPPPNRELHADAGCGNVPSRNAHAVCQRQRQTPSAAQK